MTTIWTEEMKATAAGMKRAGLPTKTIAARLGVTPGAVQGCLARLGARKTLDGHYTTHRMGRMQRANVTTYHDED